MSPAAARANFMVALCDLGFALALFACGLFAAPFWLTGLAATGMVAYWGWSRRRTLRRLPGRAWASQTGIALFVIIAIEAGAYWLGLGAGGAI
jgi:hypothetical protein